MPGSFSEFRDGVWGSGSTGGGSTDVAVRDPIPSPSELRGLPRVARGLPCTATPVPAGLPCNAIAAAAGSESAAAIAPGELPTLDMLIRGVCGGGWGGGEGACSWSEDVG